MALRVLVVDDSVDTAESLAMLLTIWGHAACVARSGAEAVTVAAGFSPQVALVDLKMPGMTGFELGCPLTQDHQGIVLIAVTGLTSEEQRRHCEEAGFFLRWLKPVDLDRLQQLLQKLAAEPELTSALAG
jgi:CheY-like chemotaxis protein